MKFYLTLAMLALSLTIVNAQENNTFNSSRPGQAFTPQTVEKYTFQFQSGLSLTEIWHRDFSDFNLVAFRSASTMRYGLSDKVELRAELGWFREQESLSETTPFIEGIDRVSIGSRIKLWENASKDQLLSFQQRLDLPVVFGSFFETPAIFQLLFTYSRPLIGATSLTTNLGWTSSTIFEGNLLDYVINVAFPITKNLSGFVEHYGSFLFDDLILAADGGLALMVSSNFQLDLSAGFGRIDSPILTNTQQWFVDTGISWRIFQKS